MEILKLIEPYIGPGATALIGFFLLWEGRQRRIDREKHPVNYAPDGHLVTCAQCMAPDVDALKADLATVKDDVGDLKAASQKADRDHGTILTVMNNILTTLAGRRS